MYYTCITIPTNKIIASGYLLIRSYQFSFQAVNFYMYSLSTLIA